MSKEESLGYGLISSPSEPVTTANELTFYSSSEPPTSSTGDEGGIITSVPRQRVLSGGRTAQFFESKGFGWLLETNDEGDEEEKPLL